MSSRAPTPAADSPNRAEASPAPLAGTVNSAFGRMMNTARDHSPLRPRDRCTRPPLTYNENYNPEQPPLTDLPYNYSPYNYGEPLFDDRPFLVARLPPRWAETPAPARPRTQWTWKLGYAFNNSTNPAKIVPMWTCKLCHHDAAFSRGKEYSFNANSPKNAEKHLRERHYLDEGGDTWRIKGLQAPQASGIVDGGYEQVIPFRQLEFKNALMEWIICENVKHRKASSPALLRAFKIANMQAAKALPTSSTTIANWIHEMFVYFEPEVIEEIKNAKSRISISFDGWGSKHEKISVLGCVVHFLNSKYEAVTRLIGLPELPGHAKDGVCKSENTKASHCF